MATDIKSKKQHIEGILGEKIADEALALIFLVQDVAISTNEPSRTTQKSILINTPNRCVDSRTLDVSGFAQTLGNGQNVFRLSNFLCPAGELFSLPINIVATPISAKPFFMTVIATLINNGMDVETKFFSWDANGAAAPNISLTGAVGLSFPTSFCETGAAVDARKPICYKKRSRALHIVLETM